MVKIIFILLVTINCCLGQTIQSGLILPDFSKVAEGEVCCIYAPKNGFIIYNSPNGQNVGKLIHQTDNQPNGKEYYKLYFIPSNSNPARQIEISKFQEVGYEVFAIPYFQRKDGFVRVLDSTEDFWLSEDEVKTKGFLIKSWQNFLSSKVGDLLGFYANEPGLTLRKEPNQYSEVVETLKGDLFEISPLNQHDGPWTKVKVKKYKEHPCNSNLKQEEIVEFEMEGWVKIIDDKGLPNVWYYSRGC